MKIDYLADHVEHVPVLAKWFHDEWSYLSPSYELLDRTERLRGRANREGIPVAFVAVSDAVPVGSASLIECDMDTHSHLMPWMSSVYVDRSARKRGLGTALVARVVEEARQQGVDRLYLWTAKEEQWYAGMGWQVFERTSYRCETAIIMAIDL